MGLPQVGRWTGTARLDVDRAGRGARPGPGRLSRVAPDDAVGGARRLVGIARAVAASPSILLLDEPAAGLDETESRELGDVVVRLARRWGMGIAIVEHDFSLVKAICDRLVVLDHGAILAEGSTGDVTKREDVVAAFIGPTHKAVVREPQAATLGSV